MFRKRIKGNRGDSNTVSMLFVILIIFFVALFVIDVGTYFMNRNVIVNSAQNGARLAAVYGGDSETPVAKKYGALSITSDCAKMDISTPVACNVLTELKNGSMTGHANVSNVSCGPVRTTKIGQRTWCEVNWQYKGFLSFLDGNHVVRASAESEVLSRD